MAAVNNQLYMPDINSSRCTAIIVDRVDDIAGQVHVGLLQDSCRLDCSTGLLLLDSLPELSQPKLFDKTLRQDSLICRQDSRSSTRHETPSVALASD